jgi:hypothetical protein
MAKTPTGINPMMPVLPASIDQNNDDMLLASKAEKEMSEETLKTQSGTPIPALYNQFYKFVQNPSTVSVDTFKRMVDTDETVGAGVDFLQTCLAARVGPFIHDSKEVTEFVNTALDKMEKGFYSNLKTSLESVWAGFSVQEMVWANDPMGFIVKKMPPLPQSSILFECERNGELTWDGILQYQRNYYPGGIAYGQTPYLGFSIGAAWPGYPDPWAKFGDMPWPVRTGNAYSFMSVRIPVEKCLHIAFHGPGLNQNPYGRSLLRRAYKWWVAKDAYIRMLSVALDRKGTPLTIIFADGNATVQDQSQGVQKGNTARGNAGAGISAAQAVARAFANVHNDSVITLPGRKDQVYSVQELGRGSNSDDFLAAIDKCNQGIMRALLIPPLVMGQGDGTGSFALGQEHARTWEKILDGMNSSIKDAWINRYIKQLIMYNFPESAYAKDGFGKFSKQELSQDERDKEMGIIEKAVNTGAIDHTDLSDLNQTRDKLGYTPRTTPIITERDEGLPTEYDDEDQEKNGEKKGDKGAKDSDKKSDEA